MFIFVNYFLFYLNNMSINDLFYIKYNNTKDALILGLKVMKKIFKYSYNLIC